jgi:large conductance mechanosensitive channel
MLTEFRNFVLRGNVIDLAVGVIAGVAFGAVVNSLVNDVITPLIAVIAHTPDFSSMAVLVRNSSGDLLWFTDKVHSPGYEGGVLLGNFINAVISFVLTMAGVFFLVVKPINAMQRTFGMVDEEVTAAPAEEIAARALVEHLTEVRVVPDGDGWKLVR